jgi:hypothetical protein
MTLGVELEVMEDQQKELTINIYCRAEDEVQLITKSIIELISQIDLPNCDDDQDKFENEMSKIFFAIAKNYNKNGMMLNNMKL